MPMKSIHDPALIEKALKIARQQGLAQAARETGIHPNTIRVWVKKGPPPQRLSKAEVLAELVEMIRTHGPIISHYQFRAQARHPGGWQQHWTLWTDFFKAGQKAAGVTPEQVAEAERRRLREMDKVVELRRQLAQAQREANAADDLRRSVFELAEQPIDPPRWTFEPAKSVDSTPGIPVLFASDFQWGEVIKANELDGINAFNNKVASARYKRLIERTIDLCFAHMVNPKYPGILYLRGGDMVSGDIHQELRETNDLQSIPAAIDLIEHEAAGIRALAERFGKVWVISVPGNHGRTTIKPHAKQYVETNYDYLIAVMLEREFRSDSRVQFMTPMSGDARFKVYDWAFVLTHGDRIGSSGGQGFIGPAATITRGMKKLVDYYAALRQHVDYCLVGHFHTAMELEYGFANGSLPGYSEYAKTFRARPQPPTQWLLFVHPRNGITARWKILLDGQARMRMTGQPVEMAA